MKLRLYYPTKPFFIFQHFAQCEVGICDYYRSLGLAGHNGLDIDAATGTKVYAAHDGQVVFAGEDGSGGWGIVIRTDREYEYKDGDAYYKSIYWHLLPSGIKVKAGDNVKTGDLIALSDATGFTTGAHLHFGLKPVYKGENDWTWWNAEQENGFKGAIDPEPFFTGIHAADVPAQISLYTSLISILKSMVGLLSAKNK